MIEIFALEESGGQYEDHYTSVLAVSPSREKLEALKAEKEAHHKEMMRQCALYYDFNHKLRMEYPAPTNPSKFYTTASYPRWKSDQVITQEMRDERARIIADHKAMQAELVLPVRQHHLIHEIVLGIFAHVNGITKEAIEYDRFNGEQWDITTIPYIE